ncbi:MAG: hypothetical protein ACI9VR_003656 [Cognaticolwellia sp.]|jgi:hypothetical protein
MAMFPMLAAIVPLLVAKPLPAKTTLYAPRLLVPPELQELALESTCTVTLERSGSGKIQIPVAGQLLIEFDSTGLPTRLTPDSQCPAPVVEAFEEVLPDWRLWPHQVDGMAQPSTYPIRLHSSFE